MGHEVRTAKQNPPSADTAEKRRFAELSLVSLSRAMDIEGRMLPVGTRGTVVAAYEDGIGYEVEIFAPFHAVVTLEAGDLIA